MLTIFSIPKAFRGHVGVIQRNAVASWRRLSPRPTIILCGNEEGTAAIAREFGLGHAPELGLNEYGTPLVSDAFAHAARQATTPYLMYSNADMLYDNSVYDSLEVARRLRQFLMSGRRWDIDITESLCALDGSQWEALFASRAARGKLHGSAGMDYFVFPRGIPIEMPPLAVGRVGWDSWLVWRSRMRGIPVIDATAALCAVHQNHDYGDLRLGYQHDGGAERDLNYAAIGGIANMLTLREATLLLVNGRLESPSFFARLPSMLATWRPYQMLLGLKRRMS